MSTCSSIGRCILSQSKGRGLKKFMGRGPSPSFFFLRISLLQSYSFPNLLTVKAPPCKTNCKVPSMLAFSFSHAHHLRPILETTHLLTQSAPVKIFVLSSGLNDFYARHTLSNVLGKHLFVGQLCLTPPNGSILVSSLIALIAILCNNRAIFTIEWFQNS